MFRLNWLETTELPFKILMQLEKIQLSWLPGWIPDREMAIAVQANPEVELKMRETCPELDNWLGSLKAKISREELTKEEIRNAELTVINTIEDQIVYAAFPEKYDALSFLQWDPVELNSLVDFTGKTVIDIGSGTGKLAFIAAVKAELVYAVEPIANLRKFIMEKAEKLYFKNIRAIDGLIESLPLKDGIADVTMEGHVFSQPFEQAHGEMVRVTRSNGMLIHCPANLDKDNEKHKFLIENGFEWSRFEEPGDGWKRKYWKRSKL
jgi:SAM-dependent methyltransferase